MAENSHIGWTTHTHNAWIGCTKVSAGCKHCYAETLAKGRMQLTVWGPAADRKPMSESYWRQIAKWNRAAEKSGETVRVFCGSLCDVFEGPETCQNPEAYAVVTAGRERLFREIEAAPHLTFLLLTKRPENMTRFAPPAWAGGWPANVWAMTSVEDQTAADTRIPYLLKVPAAVRGLSCEPLLGPVDLRCVAVVDGADGVSKGYDVLHGCRWWCSDQGEYAEDSPKIGWVIVGGESGSHARPMHPDWARSLRDQCVEAGTPFFWKQWGEFSPVGPLNAPQRIVSIHGPSFDPSDIKGMEAQPRPWHFQNMYRVGKKAAGRLLDGVEHSQFPVTGEAA